MNNYPTLRARLCELLPEIRYSHGAECLKCKKGFLIDDVTKEYVSGDKNFRYGNKGGYRLNHTGCSGEVVEVSNVPDNHFTRPNLQDTLLSFARAKNMQNHSVAFSIFLGGFFNLYDLTKPLSEQSESFYSFILELLK